MFVIQRPHNSPVPVGLLRVRRSRQAVDQTRLVTRLRLQVSAAWRATTLDRMLADGVDPESSAVLALRARKLTGPRGRNQVANGLAAAIRTATETRPGFTSALRPRASELLEARAVVAALERRLQGASPVTPQGVAMLGRLLTDPASPLYQPSRTGELASGLRTAAAVLDHSPELAQRWWPVTREEVGR
jgi:hypothetical protein